MVRNTVVLYLALGLTVYTTLWNENILVAEESYKLAVAANANLWLKKLNLQSISIVLRHVVILK